MKRWRTSTLEEEHGRLEVDWDDWVSHTTLAEQVGQSVRVLTHVGDFDGSGPVLVGVVGCECQRMELSIADRSWFRVVRDGVMDWFVSAERRSTWNKEEVVSSTGNSGQVLDNSSTRAISVFSSV